MSEPEYVQRCRVLISEGDTIGAIKLWRYGAGVPLKHAKEAIDALRSGMPAEIGTAYERGVAAERKRVLEAIEEVREKSISPLWDRLEQACCNDVLDALRAAIESKEVGS